MPGDMRKAKKPLWTSGENTKNLFQSSVTGANGVGHWHDFGFYSELGNH